MHPTFTIITPVHNSANTIRDTINSVLAQKGVGIELIVIDGNSTDQTVEIVEKYQDERLLLVSEPDQGIYDAMNKGLRMASGEFVGILNSDDYYVHPWVLLEVANKFHKTQADAVYGDINFVAPDNPHRITRIWKSGAFRASKFLFGWMPPHPAFFTRLICYKRYGLFDIDLKSSADYELMLRFLYKHRLRAAYLPSVVTHMRTGGQSSVTWRNRLRANREDHAAWRKNGLRPLPITILMKPIRKIPQFWVFHNKTSARYFFPAVLEERPHPATD